MSSVPADADHGLDRPSTTPMRERLWPPSAAGGAVRQQRMPGGRQYRPTVRYSAEEYGIVVARARAARKSVPHYITDASLAEPAQPVRVPAALLAELSAISQRVAAIEDSADRLASGGNAGVDAPPGQVAVLGNAAEAMRQRLDAVLVWLTNPGRQ